jgi:hypothetical protein
MNIIDEVMKNEIFFSELANMLDIKNFLAIDVRTVEDLFRFLNQTLPKEFKQALILISAERFGECEEFKRNFNKIRPVKVICTYGTTINRNFIVIGIGH